MKPNKQVQVGRPMVKVTNEYPYQRIDTIKSVIVEHRSKAKACASYELYGVLYGEDDVKVERVEHAPTSADFAPMATKSRIAGYLKVYEMVAEFRGAWKSDAEAKVIAYELQPSA